MAEDDSPLVRDIWISDAGIHVINEDSICNTDHSFIHDSKKWFSFKKKTTIKRLFLVEIDDKDGILPTSDLILLNYPKEYDVAPETMSIDPFLPNSTLDFTYSKRKIFS